MDLSKDFILKGSLILTFSNLTVRFLSYAYRLLMAGMLDPYEYGILNLALPLQFLVILLASAGIAPSIAKFVSENIAERKGAGDIVSSSVYYYGILGLAFGSILIVGASKIGVVFFGEADAVLPLQIAALSIPVGIVLSVYTGAFQGLKRVDYMSAVLLVGQAMRIVLSVALVLTGFGVVGAIGGSTFGFALALPLAFFMYKRLGAEEGARDYRVFKEVLYFSIPTSVAALSSFILAYADIFLIGFFLTPFEVGIYSAASPASRIIFAFTMALYAVLIPTVSEKWATGQVSEIKSYFNKSLIGLAIVGVPATMISVLFSEEIIGLLFTDDYLGATASFELLVVGAAFMSLYMICAGIYQGIGRPGTPMKILFFFAVTDILLNIILIPGFGIEGAALSTALAGIGAGLLSAVLLARYLKNECSSFA